VKPLILDLKDPSQGNLPPQGRLVQLLRRILGLKDPLADGSPPLRPSVVERLDDFFAHDRPRLNEVLPRLESHAAKPSKDMETASSSERGRIQAPAHAAPPALHGPKGKERPIHLGSSSPRDYSLVQELRASLPRQSLTRRTARNHGRHRKLIFACLSVSVLILILGAAVIFVRRQAARKAELAASSSPIPAQVSAPSVTEPLPEATPDSGTPETQPPPTNPDGQPTVRAQPSIPAASPSVVGKLTSPAAPRKKVPPPAEKPPRPVPAGEVPGGVPGGQGGTALSGIAPEPSRPAPAPPLQMQAPAKTPGETANRSTGLQADTGRATEEASGSLGASGTSERTSGVKITQITADGPAAQAGLRVGDIITELDGVPVRMAQILDAQIALRKPGSKIRISYIRNSLPGKATVTVGKRVTP